MKIGIHGTHAPCVSHSLSLSTCYSWDSCTMYFSFSLSVNVSYLHGEILGSGWFLEGFLSHWSLVLHESRVVTDISNNQFHYLCLSKSEMRLVIYGSGQLLGSKDFPVLCVVVKNKKENRVREKITQTEYTNDLPRFGSNVMPTSSPTPFSANFTIGNAKYKGVFLKPV